MKKKKLIVSLVGMVVLSVGLASGKVEAARADYVTVPSNQIFEELQRSYLDVLTEPEVSNLENYGILPLEMFNRKNFNSYTVGVSPRESPSLAGLENVKTKQLQIGGEILDFTPVEKMTELEDIRILNYNNENERNSQNGIMDLNFVKDLKNLKKFDYSTFGGSLALTDLSALNELPNLEQIDVITQGELPSISLKKNYRRYEVYAPVTFSKHFDPSTVRYSLNNRDGSTCTETDGVIKWTQIPVGTKELRLTVFATGSVPLRRVSYQGYFNIPIIWK